MVAASLRWRDDALMDDAPKPEKGGFLGKVVKNISSDLRETGSTLKGEVMRTPKPSTPIAPTPAQPSPEQPSSPIPRQDGLVMEVRGEIGVKNEWRPNRLLIYEDRVEEVNPGFLQRQTHQTIRYPQIAQVAAKKGLVWNTLVVETVGGGSITMQGLRKENAERARLEIDKRVAAAWASRTEAPKDESSGALSTELARLAELRDSGVLSDEEFAAAKRSLLGLGDPA